MRGLLLRTLTLLLLTAHHARGEPGCAAQIAVPKIAILFLARADMPLAPVWEPWFRSVAGLVPYMEALKQLCDSENGFTDVASLQCRVSEDEPVLQQQALFSVYVHSSRQDGFQDFPPGHLFHGTLISEIVPTQWGDTIDATRAQLAHALRDPLNERFILLSDTDVPLYPARLVYLQLMSEEKSRVAACKRYDLVNLNRYTCSMADMGVDFHHWRKGSQWLALTRPHAQMVHDDDIVRAAFNAHCAGVFQDEELGVHRGCLSDEHYYHTLFGYMGKDYETDCKGSLSFSDFTDSVAGHPKKYSAGEVTPELMAGLRRPLGWMGLALCSQDERVWRQAQEGFRQVPVELGEADCLEAQEDGFQGMETWCQLFARKFAGDCAAPLVELFTNEPSNMAIYPL